MHFIGSRSHFQLGAYRNITSNWEHTEVFRIGTRSQIKLGAYRKYTPNWETTEITPHPPHFWRLPERFLDPTPRKHEFHTFSPDFSQNFAHFLHTPETQILHTFYTLFLDTFLTLFLDPFLDPIFDTIFGPIVDTFYTHFTHSTPITHITQHTMISFNTLGLD